MLATMPSVGIRVRPAAPEDAAELIRLRRTLLAGSKAYYATSDPEEHRQWEQRFVHWLGKASGSPNACIAVIEGGGSSLAACGIAIIDERPPGPGLVDGQSGWVQSMVTDERARGRGYASAILEHLLKWFARAGVDRVLLNTTSSGRRLYLTHGFVACGEDTLVAQLNRTPPAPGA
jgi:GNAT superfamily N-acetyltransferase